MGLKFSSSDCCSGTALHASHLTWLRNRGPPPLLDPRQIHGNICMAAVLVTSSLDWKLSGFDLLSEHALPADHLLQHSSWMVGRRGEAGGQAAH